MTASNQNLTANLAVVADTFMCLKALHTEYASIMIDGTMRLNDLARIERLINTANQMLAMGGIDPKFHDAVKTEYKWVFDYE